MYLPSKWWQHCTSLFLSHFFFQHYQNPCLCSSKQHTSNTSVIYHALSLLFSRIALAIIQIFHILLADDTFLNAVFTSATLLSSINHPSQTSPPSAYSLTASLLFLLTRWKNLSPFFFVLFGAKPQWRFLITAVKLSTPSRCISVHM